MKRILILSLIVVAGLATLAPNCSFGQWSQHGAQILKLGDSFQGRSGAIESKEGVVWAGTDSLWVSRDTGLAWQFAGIAVAPNDCIASIAFHDKDNGVVLTCNSYLYKTTNGGNSWKMLGPIGPTGACICYDGTSNDLIGADASTGKIYFSRDGGIMWSQSNLNFRMPVTEIQSKRPGEAWALSLEAIFYSSDFGMSWHQRDTFPWLNFDHIALDSSHEILFAAAGEAFGFKASETGAPSAAIFASCDGGFDWDTLFTTDVDVFCGSIATGTNTIYCQKTTNPGFYRSTDLGESWAGIGGPISRQDKKYFTLIDDNSIVAADSIGSMWRTTNGGGTPVVMNNNQVSAYRSHQYITPAGIESDVEIVLSGISNGGLSADSVWVSADYDSNVISLQSILPPLGWVLKMQSGMSGKIHLLFEKVGGVPIDSTLHVCTLVFLCSTTNISSIDVSQSSFETHLDVSQSFGQTRTFACVSNSSYQNPITINCGTPTLLNFIKTGKIPLAIQSITPNPASSVAEISLVNPTSAPVSYAVMDALGQSRQQGEVIGNALSLDVSHLVPGVYFLRATRGDGISVSRQFVVLR